MRAAEHCSSSTGAEHALGEILVLGDVWREMAIIGHWVGESLILRWAELTRELSRHGLSDDAQRAFTSHVLQQLMQRPESSRDMQLGSQIHRRLPDLRCVWTDQAVSARGFHVDHVIPFNLWFNNELWNLLPAGPRVQLQIGQAGCAADATGQRPEARWPSTSTRRPTDHSFVAATRAPAAGNPPPSPAW